MPTSTPVRIDKANAGMLQFLSLKLGIRFRRRVTMPETINYLLIGYSDPTVRETIEAAIKEYKGK
jgi:hypothetical protein